MTRQVWQRDKHGRPTRLVTVETYTDGVKSPPAWVWVALAVLVVGLAVWDGGVWW